MKIFVSNSIVVLSINLNLLRWSGILVPDDFTGFKKVLFFMYSSFWTVFVIGMIIPQIIALYQVWGDVNQMTGIGFLLFTNMTFASKVVNMKLKRSAVLDIIDEGEHELKKEDGEEGKRIINTMNRETALLLILYAIVGTVTMTGWVAGAQHLPFPAWYPYDTTKFPAFHLTFFYQIAGAMYSALNNTSMDFMVTTSIAVCRVRLQLINSSLRRLSSGITRGAVGTKLSTLDAEELVKSRLRRCILQHQAVLHTIALIQRSFTAAILAQFTVSIIIICVTAYQLAENNNVNIYSSISMMSYFIGMVLQVFFYCYQAHQLTEESVSVAEAVYCCPWYVYSCELRRGLLVMMVRSRRTSEITAGGFATLSLACFVSIIRASYSFFTVLKQME